MQAHTKKLRTDDIISLTVAGPANNKARVLRAVKIFGFSWHEMQGGHDPKGAFGMYRNTTEAHFRDGKREKADRKEKCPKTGKGVECRL
jgi:hypothetical protein